MWTDKDAPFTQKSTAYATYYIRVRRVRDSLTFLIAKESGKKDMLSFELPGQY